MIAPLPPNEEARLLKLASYAILDSLPEPTFDRVTRLAARLFDVPMALVSLVDEKRQWFKSCFGIDTRQTDRSLAFCAYTILSPEAMVVPDATRDPRFADHPLVTGPLNIRFYAGAPLKTPDGFNLGSLCIIDTKPRSMSPDELDTLSDLAAIVVDELELRSAVEQMHNLASIVEQSEDAIYSRNTDDIILTWNQGAQDLFGYSASEMIGQSALVLAPPEHQAEIAQTWERVLRGEEIGHFETVRRHKNGSPLDVSLSISPIRNSAGAIVAASVIARDIGERKLADAELIQAKEVAESATRAKSEFLANMSHEIRTPMNGVLGTLGLLLDSELSPSQRELAEISRASAETLLTIINDILDFSKIEAGQMTIEPIPFDSLQTMEEVMGMIAPRAQEKGIELIMRYAPDAPRLIVGDPGRIRQVLTNLVSNAIKFTAQGHILVNIEADNVEADLSARAQVLADGVEGEEKVQLRVTVEDTGIGIAEDKMGSLWHKFTQADTSTTRRFGGTGLGLAISKQLVELMGGQIGARSREGEGSAFWFSLPLTRNLDEPTDFAPRESLAGVQVLVVDDNPINRRVLHEQLSNWKLRNRTCASGQEALQVLLAAQQAGEPFQVAILDFQMPDMDGEMLARAIRSEPSLRHTALLMLSSLGLREDTGHLKRLGFGAYLMKPARQSELLDALTDLWTAHSRGEMRGLITRQTITASRRVGSVASAPVERSHRRVLVAEDNSANQKIASMMLRSLNCSVDVAANGEEAVRMLNTIPYDVVFMDCEMPVMDGFAATRAIRGRSDERARIPIVAVTAQAMSGDRERCLNAGMDDYITKPVQAKDFAAALDRWAHTSDAEAQAQAQAEAAPPEQVASESSAPETEFKSAPEAEAALDPEVMAGLRALAEATDISLLQEIIDAFLSDSAVRLESLRLAASNGDAQVLHRDAHALKGASANIGASRMAHLSQELQAMGEEDSIEGAMPIIEQLEEEFAKVWGELEVELEKITP